MSVSSCRETRRRSGASGALAFSMLRRSISVTGDTGRLRRSRCNHTSPRNVNINFTWFSVSISGILSFHERKLFVYGTWVGAAWWHNKGSIFSYTNSRTFGSRKRYYTSGIRNRHIINCAPIKSFIVHQFNEKGI